MGLLNLIFADFGLLMSFLMYLFGGLIRGLW